MCWLVVRPPRQYKMMDLHNCARFVRPVGACRNCGCFCGNHDEYSPCSGEKCVRCGLELLVPSEPLDDPFLDPP
eukprot:g64658.t1